MLRKLRVRSVIAYLVFFAGCAFVIFEMSRLLGVFEASQNIETDRLPMETPEAR